MTMADRAMVTAAVEEPISMASEVRAGLLEALPSLPSKYFYDDRGSRLFEEITRLPEYYPTRTEHAILAAEADAIVAAAAPRELVEFGAGSGRKIRTLLDAMGRAGLRERCVLLDINECFVRRAAAGLRESYPDLDARGVVGDFLVDTDAVGRGRDRLALFLAGTIGNLEPQVAAEFLDGVAAVLTPGEHFLVGLDLVKEVAVLEAAYNDAAGVTAAFNLNILRVLNLNLGADFPLSAFAHVAFFDRERSRIEMRLRARRPVSVRVPACGLELVYRPGDEIRTEISTKYTRSSLRELVEETGFELAQWYTDAEERFALALLRRQ